MCGICGFNWEDKDLIKAMTKSIEHRGPDGGAVFTDSNISLGHRRLSIIDLSTAGTQPMPNVEGDLWITFNGEIYNFQELKDELVSKGYTFKSNTDTEMLISAYAEWGPQMLSKLNGMFSFAIWDMKKKE